MAASAVTQTNQGSDYFNNQPSIRSRPTAGGGGLTPNSPKTPLLGRSVSGAFGSPGSFIRDQEEVVIYELSPRHFSAGFAGESQPRCTVRFRYGSNDGARVGDYRQLIRNSSQDPRSLAERAGTEACELYRVDLRSVDLGLVHDKLERVVRGVHVDHLQLDQKPRKAVLVTPSLVPTRILEVAMSILFNHHAQPSAITHLTAPIMSAVGAGLRHALVLDIGWEESVATAIGEYKVVAERRSIRGGKNLVNRVADLLHDEAGVAGQPESTTISCKVAESVTERTAWCRPTPQTVIDRGDESPATLKIPVSAGISVEMPFDRLAEPAETCFFPSATTSDRQLFFDDNELPLHSLVYNALLSLPLELRAICVSRIVITGAHSQIPGLKRRLLYELQGMIESRGWSHVQFQGSTSRSEGRQARKENTASGTPDTVADLSNEDVSRDNSSIEDRAELKYSDRLREPVDGEADSEDMVQAQDQGVTLPARDRHHDDTSDPVTLKAEGRNAKKRSRPVAGKVRGIDTLGAWAGASMMANLRVKGVHETEREDFLKHGLRDSQAAII